MPCCDSATAAWPVMRARAVAPGSGCGWSCSRPCCRGADEGPGRAQVAAALADLAEIQALVALPVWCGDVAPGEEAPCIDDRESLDLQLKLMDLIASQLTHRLEQAATKLRAMALAER